MSSSTIESTVAEMAAETGATRRTIPAGVFWAICVLGVVAGGYYIEQLIVARQAVLHLMDLGVYQIAGQRVSDGTSVYDTPLLGNTRGVWEFVYTPFAALLFVPLVALHGDLFTYVGGLANFAMLIATVWTALAMLDYRRDRRLVLLSVAVAALLLWCEPVRETMAFGQINIFLMLLVLADMAMPDSSRWKGALTGIAAGIKLTPAFFVIYLLVTRRYRAAATAIGAFAATVLVGFAAMPKDSLTYWSGAFVDPARVGVPEIVSNESLRGMVARSVGVQGVYQLLWLAAAAAIAVVGLTLARRLSFTGHELSAVVLCGLIMATVSPFSWVHHWVWLAPLLIYSTDLALRRGGVLAPAGLVVAVVVTSGGLLNFYDPAIVSVFDASKGNLTVWCRNAYIWLTFALLAVTAWQLRRAADRTAVRTTNIEARSEI
ncbi:glycosyltransferase 87 family protein [Nocardia sp. KC 131]|uniref:glycosyltransferase 87 family protein n=1 Tax=Nocardia arseniciresistens TaxID=3392119 RepID=UPI00398F7649